MRFPLVLCLTSLLHGQELVWEVFSQAGVANSVCWPEYGDFDRDGAQDLLVGASDVSASPWYSLLLRVLSGVDGSLLTELQIPYGSLGHLTTVGDFDRDTFPDVAFFTTSGHIEVWSIAQRYRLLQIPVVSGAYGGALCGNLDVNGDGQIDIVHSNGLGAIVVHSHSGAQLYSIPALTLGFDAVDAEGVGDLDGDGGDDFIVGGAEAFSGMALGAVVLFSGRTGTPLRIHFGSHVLGGINREVRRAGDVDGDGVMDFAAGNMDFPSGLVMIWSGATGAVLNEWYVPVGQLSGSILAGRDVDLDGRPDIIDIAPAYLNTPPTPTYAGRVRTLSTRDGQDLVQVVSQQATGGGGGFGQSYADLGVQPGNPYPVFAIVDEPLPTIFPGGFCRIRAYRTSPKGTQFVGVGCSSSGKVPTIGIRRVTATPNDSSRLVLGSAPADSLAICVVAPANVTTAGGITTPFALDPFGLIGCQLLVPDVIHHAAFTGSTGMDRGYAAFDFPQTMAATGGTLFAAQWLVLDTTTPGYATTVRYEFRLQ